MRNLVFLPRFGFDVNSANEILHAVHPELSLRVLGDVVSMEIPEFCNVKALLLSLHELQEDGKLRAILPGLGPMHVVQNDAETNRLLREWAASAEENESMETLSNTAVRLWGGVRPHPEWEEYCLPRVYKGPASYMGIVYCVECGRLIRGASVRWQAPSGTVALFWSTLGLCLPNCGDPQIGTATIKN